MTNEHESGRETGHGSMRGEERPYVRPERSSFALPLAALSIALVAALAGYYYYYQAKRAAPPATARAPAEAAKPAPQASAPPPAISHPLKQPEAGEPLPALDQSDAVMSRSLSKLIGGKAFRDFVVPDRLIRRIVATVDNLPRRTAPQRVMPLNPVPGGFIATGTDGGKVIGRANFARYAPYVRVLESVQPEALVRSYARAYPLFQRAYEELGYPGKYFNDRLMEAIDDMLAAPERDPPVALIRPRILYEYADPDLETRSAGQKIMIRMGRENAWRVKTKLRQIRRELLAASGPRP